MFPREQKGCSPHKTWGIPSVNVCPGLRRDDFHVVPNFPSQATNYRRQNLGGQTSSAFHCSISDGGQRPGSIRDAGGTHPYPAMARTSRARGRIAFHRVCGTSARRAVTRQQAADTTCWVPVPTRPGCRATSRRCTMVDLPESDGDLMRDGFAQSEFHATRAAIHPDKLSVLLHLDRR